MLIKIGCFVHLTSGHVQFNNYKLIMYFFNIVELNIVRVSLACLSVKFFFRQNLSVKLGSKLTLSPCMFTPAGTVYTGGSFYLLR
jgi:hypothetical protein